MILILMFVAGGFTLGLILLFALEYLLMHPGTRWKAHIRRSLAGLVTIFVSGMLTFLLSLNLANQGVPQAFAWISWPWVGELIWWLVIIGDVLIFANSYRLRPP